MIINQIASGNGGSGIDTSDATAYAEHILNGYTAYGRGAKITGSFVPPASLLGVLNAIWAESTGGTSLSLSIKTKVGVTIVAVVTTRSATTFSAGWQVVHSILNFSTSTQNLYVLEKVATSTTETLTVTQSSAVRIYIELIAFTREISLQVLWYAVSANDSGGIVTPPNKTADELILYALSANIWASGKWITTPADIIGYSSILDGSDRQRVFFDCGIGAISRTFTAVTSTGWGAVMLKIT